MEMSWVLMSISNETCHTSSRNDEVWTTEVIQPYAKPSISIYEFILSGLYNCYFVGHIVMEEVLEASCKGKWVINTRSWKQGHWQPNFILLKRTRLSHKDPIWIMAPGSPKPSTTQKLNSLYNSTVYNCPPYPCLTPQSILNSENVPKGANTDRWWQSGANSLNWGPKWVEAACGDYAVLASYAGRIYGQIIVVMMGRSLRSSQCPRRDAFTPPAFESPHLTPANKSRLSSSAETLGDTWAEWSGQRSCRCVETMI
jgi:hypothetical protein